MNIGIIDAELLSNKNHRFPNLVCMKISGFYKGAATLLLDWKDIDLYDKVFVSKVFTSTVVPDEVFSNPKIEYGGTGFFFDQAPPLPHEIEHTMPDYHLYDKWVSQQRQKDVRYYTDYSIGFTTRGCFRRCSYCVNRNKKKVELASPIAEFYDPSRKAICLLDDQFFGYKECESILNQLQALNKPFQYKQGLDIRLMTDTLAKKLTTSKYDGSYIFAFDNIKDTVRIRKKLSLWRKHCTKNTTLYVLCGYNKAKQKSEKFWITNLLQCFERIFILAEYNCITYAMRHEDYLQSPFPKIYTLMASWANQPWVLKTMTFRQFCIGKGMGTFYKTYKHDTERYLKDGHTKLSAWTAMEQFLERYPFMSVWFDMKFRNKVVES